MEALDFKKLFKAYYSPKPSKPETTVVPDIQYIMVDGTGDPNGSQTFQDAIGALYSVAYSLKFARKKAGIGPDFSIGPLEGLWWDKAGRA